MRKDFRAWHTKKECINEGLAPNFHERDIWHCHLGANVGHEQDGAGEEFLRPIVVIRKFNSSIFWGIPITRTIRHSPYQFSFFFGGKENSAIISQLRLIDARRLHVQIGYINKNDFETLKQKTKALLP